jgi:GNAT superfamily N-acetyltransferase
MSDTPFLSVVKATTEDAVLLTQMQREAFEKEADLFRIEKNRGPGGYDSLERNTELIEQGRMFKIIFSEEVVGGAVVTVENRTKARLNRIFISPRKQGNGIGSQAVCVIEGMYPEVLSWELDTPYWSIRNQRFYQKLGYHRTTLSLEPGSGFIIYIYRKENKGE